MKGEYSYLFFQRNKDLNKEITTLCKISVVFKHIILCFNDKPCLNPNGFIWNPIHWSYPTLLVIMTKRVVYNQ